MPIIRPVGNIPYTRTRTRQQRMTYIGTSENLIPEITPQLTQLTDVIRQTDPGNTTGLTKTVHRSKSTRGQCQPGNQVLITSHSLSNATKGESSKLNPRRDGPYTILQKASQTTYEIANPNNHALPLGNTTCPP
uniref:Uncharacterized protein n=1 Tax=Photinus pyralis TaxID=7054 RepID=A0A1Y1L2T1_PHOPY